MDAHKALIQDIFNNGTLIEVPFFQRSYVWKDDLWQRSSGVILINRHHIIFIELGNTKFRINRTLIP